MQILRKEMKLKGLTSKDLAKKIDGITESSVKKWLMGEFNPGIKIIPQLLALGFSETACLNPSKDVEV